MHSLDSGQAFSYYGTTEGGQIGVVQGSQLPKSPRFAGDPELSGSSAQEPLASLIGPFVMPSKTPRQVAVRHETGDYDESDLLEHAQELLLREVNDKAEVGSVCACVCAAKASQYGVIE